MDDNDGMSIVVLHDIMDDNDGMSIVVLHDTARHYGKNLLRPPRLLGMCNCSKLRCAINYHLHVSAASPALSPTVLRLTHSLEPWTTFITCESLSLVVLHTADCPLSVDSAHETLHFVAVDDPHLFEARLRAMLGRFERESR